MKNEEQSVQLPCISALQWRMSTTLLLRKYEESTGGKNGRVKKEQLKDEEKQAWSVKKMQKQMEENNVAKKEEVQVVDQVHMTSGEEQKEEWKESVGGPLLSPISSLPSCDLLRPIDSILGASLGSFLFEVQRILQEESIPYILPHSPHSTVTADITELQYTHTQTAISQFLQCMSLNNTWSEISVQKYVVQLQDGINTMLPEFDHSWLRDKPSTSSFNTRALKFLI